MAEVEKAPETKEDHPSVLAPLKAAFAELDRRIRGPFLGPIAIAWVFWNIQPILLILSTLPVLTKLEILRNEYYPDGIGELRGFFYPVGSALEPV